MKEKFFKRRYILNKSKLIYRRDGKGTGIASEED